jgi:Cu-Zn family superoxide dismutase
MKAIAVIDDPKVKGQVAFVEERGGVAVRAHFTQMPAGKHGFHIHEFGDMSGGCATLGAHWNPTGQEHGGVHSRVRHAGDFGNVERGKVYRYFIEGARILDGSAHFRVLGRSVVIHEGQDDLGLGSALDSKTTGGSGARIGCAVIGLCSNT